jgi:hypothetical protein
MIDLRGSPSIMDFRSPLVKYSAAAWGRRSAESPTIGGFGYRPAPQAQFPEY